MQSEDRSKKVINLLSRKHGATIDDVMRRASLETEKQARGLLDRLRAKGHKIENVGPRRFRHPAIP